MGKKDKVSALDMPDVPSGKLPEHLELQRTRVVCKSDAPIHTEGIHYSGAYAAMGVDNSLQLDSFCSNFKVEVNKLTEDEIEFDMIGIDASLANAFRRILIAGVSTMAIEKVLVANNTSVIADEVLAHRLGLIPLKADPRHFEYLSVKSEQLKWLPNGSELLMSSHTPTAKPKGYTSFSCSQDSLPEFSKNPPGVKHGDIIISKLGPSQAIELEAHAVKGIGKTHAKWSPVATAWYRMLPEVVLLKEIKNEDAENLVVKCPVKVFDIEDIGNARSLSGGFQETRAKAIELEAHAVKGIGKTHAKWSPVATAWYRMLPEVVLLKEIKNEDAENLVVKCPVKVFDIEDIGNGQTRAVVANPRACTLCRECNRGGGEDLVEIRRIKDHFIFTIESAGALPPEVLFTEAVKILEEKCERVISELS